MRHHLAKLTPALVVGGCSLIYNPSNISKPPVDATDAPMTDTPMLADAAIDAPPLADSNPALLSLEKLAPTTIYEGQGTGNSRRALLVLRGHHISPTATVTITPATDITQGAPVVSMNRDFVLIPLTIAQSDSMDTETVALTVTVNQAGATTQTLTGLSLKYLPEFPTGTAVPTANLATTLFSKVDTGNVTFTGTEPAIVRAVSSISIGDVNVAGSAGEGSTLGAAGAGGCPGGAPGSNGGCNLFTGGGAGASGSNGGGGGGFAAAGTGGAGGAAGGAMHGSELLLNYVTTAAGTNRSGGGGGGQQAGLATAGAGGGGGGTVELTAGGDITIGSINANGGNGGDGAGVAGLPNAGGGGGGSGGVIVIRSIAGTIAAGGAITATAGSGGSPAGSGGGGGAGAPGRIRIDAPGPIPTTNPTAHRGPSFAAANPTSVTTVNPPLTLFGTDGDRLDGFVIDHDNALRLGEPVDQVFANGTLEVVPTLIYGYNKLCFTQEPFTRPLTATPDPARALADTCIEIAYLP